MSAAAVRSYSDAHLQVLALWHLPINVSKTTAVAHPHGTAAPGLSSWIAQVHIAVMALPTELRILMPMALESAWWTTAISIGVSVARCSVLWINSKRTCAGAAFQGRPLVL